MSALRKLAETAYAVAMARPTSNTGIDAIEDAIQAAVNDAVKRPCAEHEALLKIALERVKRLEEALRELVALARFEGEHSNAEWDEYERRVAFALVAADAALRPEGT